MSHGQPIEAAVLGELSPDGEAAFRAHLQGCDACRAEYEERRALAALLFAEDGPPTEKARLFAALPPEGAAPAKAGWWRWALGAALAGGVAVVAATGLGPRPGVDDVTQRGGDERPRSDVALSVYAKRDGEPVRLVAEFPGSGEGTIGLDELVQLRFKGPALGQVWVVDAQGRRARWPEDGAVSARQQVGPGRFELEVRVPGPGLTAAQLEQALATRALDEVLPVAARGVLVVTP